MTKEVWHPDVDVTVELAKELITRQFSELKDIRSIRCIGEGWDNKVFLVNEKIVFRFPHRKIAEQLIVRESAILKNIHDKIALNIPIIDYEGRRTEIYPFVFHGYNLIPGVSACRAQLTDENRENSIEVIATFLKQLHSIDADTARSLGADKQVFDRTELDGLLLALDERIEKINQRNIACIDRGVYEEEVSQVKAVVLPENEKVLVHGDVYCKHVLFEDGELTGVIDWGDVGINVRAIDLAFLFNFYPKGIHHRFFDVYGDVDNASLQFARFLGIHYGLTLMLYAYDIQDDALLSEAQNSLKRINNKLMTS